MLPCYFRSWLEAIPAVEWKKTRSPLEILPQPGGTAVRSSLAKFRSRLEITPQPAGNKCQVTTFESIRCLSLKHLTCFTVLES